MDRSTCHRLAPRSGNGFPAFSLSAVSVTKDCWELEPPFHPPPTPPRRHTCTVVNTLLHTWALMHRDPNGRTTGRGSWHALQHRSHATQRHSRESWIYGWRSAQMHGIYTVFICQVCVSVLRRGNLWFTEGSRNVISSHLLWYGQQIHLHP